MSAHTFRQRTGLKQRLQRRPNHLRLVPPTMPPSTWPHRLAETLWRLHDQRWPWILAAALIVAADLAIVASTLPWWRA